MHVSAASRLESYAGRRAAYVKYTYTVDGKSYTNDQVYSIRGTGGLADKVRRLVNDLPDPVPVFHDPKNPEASYLLLNPTGTGWIAGTLGVIAGLLGLLMFLAGLAGKATR